jgi:predicted O-methyltransferase YrrM
MLHQPTVRLPLTPSFAGGETWPMSVASKIATLAWYLRRPSLYGELIRRVRAMRVSTSSTVERAEREKREGQRWCEQHVVPASRLFTSLGLSSEAPGIETLHPTEWAEAHAAVNACPVKMGGPANLEVLYHLCRGMKVERVVETGVANGWSTLAVLLALRANGEGRLASVDMPYAKMNNEAWVGCAVPQALRDRWTLIRKPDRDGLPEAIAALGTLDLAHYDSDKSYEGRMFGYHLLWAALRPGGLLLSDDIEDNSAYADFAKEVGRPTWVLPKKPGNYAGVLIK